MNDGVYLRSAEAFLDYLRDQKRASPETIRAYRSDLIQFGHFLIEHTGEELPPVPTESKRSQSVASSRN